MVHAFIVCCSSGKSRNSRLQICSFIHCLGVEAVMTLMTHRPVPSVCIVELPSQRVSSCCPDITGPQGCQTPFSGGGSQALVMEHQNLQGQLLKIKIVGFFQASILPSLGNEVLESNWHNFQMVLTITQIWEPPPRIAFFQPILGKRLFSVFRFLFGAGIQESFNFLLPRASF